MGAVQKPNLHTLEATIQKFQTKDFDDGKITKIYNDFQNGVYKYVEGTAETIEKKKVLNPDYVPLFNGTEEKTNEIIEHYEENTSTDTVGHGYSGYSMSNNAKNAYEKGSMPFSKWNKKNIIERIKNIVENYDIPFDVSKLDKMTLKDIKDEYLKKDGYHHTSKFYNTTDFYKIDIEKVLENKEVQITFDKQKYLDEKQTPIKNFYDKHKKLTENEPEQYNGKRTIKDVLIYLGTKNNKTAEIKTPIEEVTITRNDVKHLLNDNEKERSNHINRFIKTLQKPNLIIKSIENKKEYNYYIKSFKKENEEISGHVQIIKQCSDGNFYVTNHHLKNSKFKKIIKNGQIVYDLSDLSAVQKNVPDSNSISNSDTDFNPDVKTLFQPANTAGVEKTSDVEAAKKEWKEKGTDSNYFKKWFGDSKVKHSTTDKPIIVYHSSDFEFNTFKPKGSIDFPEAIYFSSSKAVSKTYGNKTYACFLKIENPYIIDAQGQSYNNLYDRLSSDINYAVNNGYDGVIVRNIRDDWGQHKNGGRKADTYIVFNSEQIKSVDNQGTFDETNPNIYYQPDNNKTVKPIEVELDSVPNQKSVSDVKKWIIENLNLLGDITVKSNGRIVKFSKGNIDRSMKDIGRNETRRNSYSKLKELVENSFHEDTDIKPADEKHKNVSHQELYYNAIIYNGKTYGVEISVDIPKSKKTPNTYAGHKVKIIEMESSALGVHQKGTTNGIDSNISINDIRELFKSNVKTLFQPAYHGSAKDFDRFDLPYALSGEGAMAHGYGVYTAKNKDVSEKYREYLNEKNDIVEFKKVCRLGGMKCNPTFLFYII